MGLPPARLIEKKRGGHSHSPVEDGLKPRVGFLFHVSPGNRVGAGSPPGEVHAADGTGLERGRGSLHRAIRPGPGTTPGSGAPHPGTDHRRTLTEWVRDAETQPEEARAGAVPDAQT